MGFLEIFTVLFMLLFLPGLIVGIVLWSTGASKGGAMSCGRCGYAVKGLTAMTCPECGVDLREAGITPGGNPVRRKAGILLTLSCSALLLLGMIAFYGAAPSPILVPNQNPTPTQQGSSGWNVPPPIQHDNGATTNFYPDDSSITTFPDGSKTIIQQDGTTSSFDKHGKEIETPSDLPDLDALQD